MALLVGCVVTAVAMAGVIGECEGPYKGRTLTPKELATVLRNHQRWLESDRTQDDERRANLCRANLQEANLGGANLQGAKLQGANLEGANLQRANLEGANLQRANLGGANLQEAYLGGAKLQEADLPGANLQRADLIQANFQGANLEGANLQRAKLPGANLQRANLSGANLQGALLYQANFQGANLQEADLQEADLRGATLAGAVYEPKPESLPILSGMTDPNNNLEKLVFYTTPAALIRLREAFKKGGMRPQERQLTYAIEHTKQLQAWNSSWYTPTEADTRPWLEKLAGKSESLFSYVLFELPSGYGMVPSRALATLGLLILVFSLVYMAALVTARGRAGIWVTWPTDRVYQEEGAKEATRVTTTFFFPRWQARAAGRWWGALLRGVSVPLIGLYFSLLSAFSLGWRELNVGTWIARMQPREYTLRATGWVRTVSGIQSLLSVYLLALWVLTYFGRPFE